MATTARVLRVERAGPVHRLRLHAPGFTFVAGQYTAVEHPGGAIPFSVASSPDSLPELELHYLPQPGNPDAERMDSLLDAAELTLADAGGDVLVSADDPRPILYACGGSGISQALAMATWTAEHRPGHPQQLVWGVREEGDLYCRADLDALAARDGIAVFTAVEANGGGTVADAVLRTEGDLSGWRVVLCGGPAMVWATFDALAERGVGSANAEADVFSYAPRA